MRRIVAAVLFIAWASFAQQAAAGAPQSSPANHPEDASAPKQSTIVVPVGTKVPLTLTSPIWAKSAKPGDSVYLATSFPVVVGNQMAIPPGTFVEGRIDALARPNIFSGHALFQLHFTKLIFATGYTVPLPEVLEKSTDTTVPTANTGAPPPQSNATAVAGAPAGVEAAVARVYVEVTPRNDILLDNGAPVEMLLQVPVTLDATAIAFAVSRSKPLLISSAKSSSRCVPIPGSPGTPGTSDTVIPGTPGTPPTVIPGAPGTPDIVIPGSPGTSPTIIPGTPGTPGTSEIPCPGPPVVVPESSGSHIKTVALAAPMELAGLTLAPGKYQFRWTGVGPTTQVEVLLKKKQVVQVQARIVILSGAPATDEIASRSNADGSVSLASLRFAGEATALLFK